MRLTGGTPQRLGVGDSPTFAGLIIGSQQYISNGGSDVTPFTIPATVSIAGSLGLYSTTQAHMFASDWTEKNVFSTWNKSTTGYSAGTYLSAANGSEQMAVGYGNHPLGGPIWRRRGFIEVSPYGVGGGTATFTNGSAVIGGANSFEVNQAVVFTTTGSLPTNFTAGNIYYVIATGLSTTQFEVATSVGGAAVVAGSAGSGTQTFGVAPNEFIIAQTGYLGTTSDQWVRSLWKTNGDIWLGGLDASSTPALIIQRTGASVVFPAASGNLAEFYNTGASGTDKLAIFWSSNVAWIQTTNSRDFKLDAANTLLLSTGGGTKFTLGANLFATASGAAYISASAASATVPVFAPNRSDATTGIGAQASGNMSAIVGAVEQVRFVSTGLTIISGKDLVLGNAATTGLSAGALAATTNASIVIKDSGGQAYRIPCII